MTSTIRQEVQTGNLNFLISTHNCIMGFKGFKWITQKFFQQIFQNTYNCQTPRLEGDTAPKGLTAQYRT